MLTGLQAAQPLDLREFVDVGLVWMNEVVGIRADARSTRSTDTRCACAAEPPEVAAGN